MTGNIWEMMGCDGSWFGAQNCSWWIIDDDVLEFWLDFVGGGDSLIWVI
jgi:hypothetical protein